MKNSLSILLLLCLLAPTVGTYIGYRVHKKAIKKEVKHTLLAGIAEKELVFFSFSEEEKNNLQWEHSKEFEYNGQMYDIVKSANKGDRYLYWCWADDKETELNKKFEELLAQTMGKDPQQKKTSQQLFQFYKTLYFPVETDFQLLIETSTVQELATFYFNFYTHGQLPPPVGPPRLG